MARRMSPDTRWQSTHRSMYFTNEKYVFNATPWQFSSIQRSQLTTTTYAGKMSTQSEHQCENTTKRIYHTLVVQCLFKFYSSFNAEIACERRMVEFQARNRIILKNAIFIIWWLNNYFLFFFVVLSCQHFAVDKCTHTKIPSNTSFCQTAIFEFASHADRCREWEHVCVCVYACGPRCLCTLNVSAFCLLSVFVRIEWRWNTQTHISAQANRENIESTANTNERNIGSAITSNIYYTIYVDCHGNFNAFNILFTPRRGA